MLLKSPMANLTKSNISNSPKRLFYPSDLNNTAIKTAKSTPILKAEYHYYKIRTK